MDAIGAEHDEDNRDFAKIIRLAQERGFARRDLDPRIGAALLQAVEIARITDETSSETLSNEQWARLTFGIYDAFILASGT